MKTNWRRVLSGLLEKDEFKPYKGTDGITLPNRAEYTGDKFPGSGDPAKIELNAWHNENHEGQELRNKEHNSKSSPLLNVK